MNPLNPNLIKFIQEEILDAHAEITPDLLVEDDLGISGDDAHDFIVAFSKRFSVDIGELILSKYFHSEVSLFITDKQPLSVEMLEQAIKSRQLK